MRKTSLVLLSVVAVAALWPHGASGQTPGQPAQDALAAGFVTPPDSARPQTWWHWVNGVVTREGIRADLEAMKKAGLGGATMFNIDQLPIDDPSVRVLNPKWRELMKFAVEEAARLHLSLGIHNATGWSSSGGPWIPPELSMQKVVWSEQAFQGPGRFPGALPQPKVDPRWNYYRGIAVLAYRTGGGVLDRESVVDLTASMDSQGALSWDAPAGAWTILRFGHTTTGAMNAPSPESGRGLECDKLSKAGVEAHFAAYPGRILAEAGPNAGHSLNRILIDSYEVGDQDWTPQFRQEFQQRRGYDPLPWLPVLAQKTVGNAEMTARVQRDWKRTVEELFADNYYGRMAELVHQHPGVEYAVEPYTGPFDTLEIGGLADVPMAEFWTKPSDWGWDSLRPVASSAHTHGKPIVAAESFTGWPHVAWQKDPYSLKATGDRAFSLGINRIVLHTTAHQPWIGVSPGMNAGWWGTQFGRTQTWWEHGAAEWISYLTRAQYLLQAGRFAGDIAWLSHGTENPPAPFGYNGDMLSEEVLLKSLTFRDGRLVLPSGMSYRVLVLPSPIMTPDLARKVRQLVSDGALVIGPKPLRSPSLQDYPASDREVERIGNEVWGDCDGRQVTEHAFGKGRVVWGKPLAETLRQAGVGPDLDLPELQNQSAILWIHRRLEPGEVYFVSNQTDASVLTPVSFRVAGLRPELWHADTGTMEPAGVWWSKDGRTVVPLRLDPSGSVFVVFRQPSAGLDPVVSVSPAGATVLARDENLQVEAARNGVYALKTAAGKSLKAKVRGLPDPVQIGGPWQLKFPPHWGAPESIKLDKLISWTAHADHGVRYFSGTATYVKEINVPARMLGSGKVVYLDLGAVKNIATVRVNGQDLGRLWKPPFRVEVTPALKVGRNHVEVEVTNLWVNRLVGDEQEPPDCEFAQEDMCDFTKQPVRVGQPLRTIPAWLLEGKPRPSPGRLTFSTYSFFTKDSPLLESGLLGPVVLQAAQRVGLNK